MQKHLNEYGKVSPFHDKVDPHATYAAPNIKAAHHVAQRINEGCRRFWQTRGVFGLDYQSWPKKQPSTSNALSVKIKIRPTKKKKKHRKLGFLASSIFASMDNHQITQEDLVSPISLLACNNHTQDNHLEP